MMFLRSGLLVWLVAMPVVAGTIEVSGKDSVLVNTGDTLLFDFSARSFAVNAAALGLREFPTAVSFLFATAAGAKGGEFTAILQSGDGLFSTTLAEPLVFGTGVLKGSTGGAPISALTGVFNLSEPASEELFGDGTAVFMLRNGGTAQTLGLATQTLGQDLYISLRGGSLSTGARLLSVTLENSSVSRAAGAMRLGNLQSPQAEVPEPFPAAMLAGGGALLCLLSKLRNRLH